MNPADTRLQSGSGGQVELETRDATVAKSGSPVEPCLRSNLEVRTSNFDQPTNGSVPMSNDAHMVLFIVDQI